ncbi:polyketide cyclase [Enemella evansiae]|uniref:SRPBCC family protein n=1 Tax=Enemella evansiae TaxID=2016499 RepID=UPI000B961405|nr:SRPBCC family protein [Enemella evansiae]OYO20509.1 polyketide cyclase [Enemella evansiae]
MIAVSQQTSASVDEVWAVLSDLERWGDLLPTFSSVTHLAGPEPTGVGTRFEVRQPGLPTAVYEVSSWEPGRGFTWAARTRGATTAATHELTSSPTGCTLTQSITWTGPLARAIRLLLAAKVRRMVAAETASLLRLAERA